MARDEVRFPFRFAAAARPMLALLGVTPGNSEVVLTADDRLVARFGPFRLETPLANVTGTRLTGGYRWLKAIGPRGSWADGGATFGTNTRSGLCICFERRVPALYGLKHPALTVTVADPEGLAAAIEARRPSDA